MKAIINKSIYLENDVIDDGYVIYEGSMIVEVGYMEEFNCDCEIVEVEGDRIVPGFIDIHTHGGYGSDFMEATTQALDNITTNLVQEGTTSVVATTMTQSDEEITRALKGINDYMINNNKTGKTQIVGIHLEGPFVNVEKKGAQPEEFIVAPDAKLLAKYNEISGNNIKVVTYAPENDKDLLATKYMQEHNIVASLGHTVVGYDLIEQAVKVGLNGATHTFNGMPKGYNDTTQTTGATIPFKEIKNELITDGVHVSREDIKNFIDKKGYDNIIVVTDSMQAKGLSDGEYELGGQKVIKTGAEARLKEGGALAGSVATMIGNFNNVQEFTGLGFKECLDMITLTPAKHLQLDKKGSIKIGNDADLVVMSGENKIVKTICRGE